MKRILAYSVLAVSLGASALTLQVIEARASAGAHLALAGSLLAGGDVDAARGELAVAARSSDPELILRGEAWCDLLDRSTPEMTTGQTTTLLADDDPFPDAVLLRRLLERGRANALADAIETSSLTLPPSLAGLAAIVRLESGGSSFQVVSLDEPAPATLHAPLRARGPDHQDHPDASSPERRSALERKLDAVLELRSRGAERIVRDRGGRLLGALGPDGQWLPSERGEPLGLDGWMSSELRAELATETPGAAAGGGVRLSLDTELSAIARQALEGVRGTIVVLEPATGRVLTAVSDPITVEREGATAFRDQRMEPASIAKLITASAALRAGFDLDHDIQKTPCHGFVAVGDGRLWCPVIPGHLSGLEHAMAVSCNTTFARLGQRLGRDRIVDEYQRFGFASFDSLGAPEGTSGNVPSARLRSPIDSRRRLAEVSIGLNHSELSPLHAASMAAIFANGGRLLEPSFVLARDGFLGLSPRAIPVDLPSEGKWTSLIEPANLRRLQAAMVAVPLYGTAGGIAPKEFPVAMKTGTAAEPGRGYHVNYIGVAPWPNPRYAFAIRITDQRTSRRVRRAAYAATSRFLDGLARFDQEQRRVPPFALERADDPIRTVGSTVTAF